MWSKIGLLEKKWLKNMRWKKMVRSSVLLQGQKKTNYRWQLQIWKISKGTNASEKKNRKNYMKKRTWELSLLIVGFRSKHKISLKAKVKKQAQPLQFSRRLSATSFWTYLMYSYDIILKMVVKLGIRDSRSSTESNWNPSRDFSPNLKQDLSGLSGFWAGSRPGNDFRV